MTGGRVNASVGSDGSPLWYHGRFNLDAVLADLVASHGFGKH